MKTKEIKNSKTLQVIMGEFATLKSTLRKTNGEGRILSRINYLRTASEAGSAALKFAALVPALAPDALVVYSKARAIVRIRGNVFEQSGDTVFSVPGGIVRLNLHIKGNRIYEHL
jgi:hypothetical protein